MTRRVLVTRPQPGAEATATRLAAMGFDPVVLPLTRIVPLAPSLAAGVPGCDAVVVTSANALRHAPADLVAAHRSLPLFAVGEATADAARRAGFSDVRFAAGTARDLTALLADTLPQGTSVLYLAGEVRTAGFEQALVQAGLALQVVETYDAEEVSYLTDLVKSALGTAPLWGATVFSERAGILLAELAARPDLRERFESVRFFCISAKAAAPLNGRGQGRVHVSSEPGHDGVLALVSSQAEP